MQFISSVAKLFKNNLTTFNKAHSLLKKLTKFLHTYLPYQVKCPNMSISDCCACLRAFKFTDPWSCDLNFRELKWRGGGGCDLCPGDQFNRDETEITCTWCSQFNE